MLKNFWHDAFILFLHERELHVEFLLIKKFPPRPTRTAVRNERPFLENFLFAFKSYSYRIIGDVYLALHAPSVFRWAYGMTFGHGTLMKKNVRKVK